MNITFGEDILEKYPHASFSEDTFDSFLSAVGYSKKDTNDININVVFAGPEAIESARVSEADEEIIERTKVTTTWSCKQNKILFPNRLLFRSQIRVPGDDLLDELLPPDTSEDSKRTMTEKYIGGVMLRQSLLGIHVSKTQDSQFDNLSTEHNKRIIKAGMFTGALLLGGMTVGSESTQFIVGWSLACHGGLAGFCLKSAGKLLDQLLPDDLDQVTLQNSFADEINYFSGDLVSLA